MWACVLCERDRESVRVGVCIAREERKRDLKLVLSVKFCDFCELWKSPNRIRITQNIFVQHSYQNESSINISSFIFWRVLIEWLENSKHWNEHISRDKMFELFLMLMPFEVQLLSFCFSLSLPCWVWEANFVLQLAGLGERARLKAAAAATTCLVLPIERRASHKSF